ncbi:hypothetical protein Tcan_06235 [Toxocara canis]|uniref:Uncharacterized protein n=1 Tax=Toxocara canis TaxID=6265 RepID=A0A0B2UW23_TOXCA|nr:hypothetical protein Tcan_06235 [Toxocara canis]
MRFVLVATVFALCVFAIKHNETRYEQNPGEFAHPVPNLTFPAKPEAVMLDIEVVRKILQQPKRIKAALMESERAKNRVRRALYEGLREKAYDYFKDLWYAYELSYEYGPIPEYHEDDYGMEPEQKIGVTLVETYFHESFFMMTNLFALVSCIFKSTRSLKCAHEFSGYRKKDNIDEKTMLSPLRHASSMK